MSQFKYHLLIAAALTIVFTTATMIIII